MADVGLMPVADALARVLAGVMPLEHEDVGLRFARGRTLGAPVVATLTQPPFAASAMDGYAVRSTDADAAGKKLLVIGTAAAGHPLDAEVGAGQAARIFTGAALPPSADAVLIQENALAQDATVEVLTSVSAGENVRPAGQDFREGDTLVRRGTRLSPRDILLAAAAGHATVEVVRKPVVAILSTGDELVEPGEPVGPGQIVGSNAYGIAALAEAAGAAAHVIGIADDTMDDLTDALRVAAGADILVTTGGASVGDHDVVRPALEKSGAHLEFYKIAMRPGKPTFFGSRVANGKMQRCLGLPGNPVASLITARVFLVPLIQALLGHADGWNTFQAVLAEPIGANGPRDHYMRANVDRSSTPPRVTPFSSQDSAKIALLAEANCLVLVPADAPPLPAGASVLAMDIDF